MPDLITPLDKAATWVLDRHFDLAMTLVVEARTWFEAGESLTADLEHALYRWRHNH